jgi:phospho-N-acetylmuramoyl-pentapeptide-transferase
MLLPIGVLVASAILGAMDDRMSLLGGTRQGGMTARFKFLWLTLFALVAASILHVPFPYGLGLSSVYLPFIGRYEIGLLYIPVAALAIIAMANAVNFTDGLDTLAAGTAAIAFVAYAIIAYRQGQLGVVTFCMTMTGALMGFLWFNAHPAQVIMGDTGSLAIGASLAVAAFMTGQWLLLPVVGAVFVAEAMSVVLQVAYFKLTRSRFGEGRRLFKMAPLHHHFEMLGWSETQVTMRFWMLAMMAGIIGVAMALVEF